MSWSWIPAGCIPCNITNTHVYIKYGNTGVSGIDFKKENGMGVITLPDREICLTTSYKNRPLDKSYDEYFSTDIYAKGGFGEKYLSGYALISAHNGIELEELCGSRYFVGSDKIKILGDCIAGESLVCTNKGILQMDEICNKNAGWHKAIEDIKVETYDKSMLITGGYTSEDKKEVYKVITKSGRTIRASSNHKLLVKGDNKHTFKKIESINAGDKIAISVGRNIWSDTDVMNDFYIVIENELLCIPFNVRISTKNTLCSFIRSFINSCSFINKNSKSIKIYLRNEIITNQLSVIFDNLGILHSIIRGKLHKNYYSKIIIKEKSSIEIFAKDIGFTSQDKDKALKNILSKEKVLKEDYDKENYIFWDEIREVIKEDNKVTMYDLNISDLHSYTANGFVVHNSGGAQLKMGTVKYVDPHKVIDWHNRIADIGACLDVPPRPIDHNYPNVLKALAVVQNRNNQIFLKEKRPDLKLLNCQHGYTLQQQRDWANRVENDQMYGWAIGADSFTSDFSNVRSALVTILEHKGNHYHLFGVSGKRRIPVIAWIGKYVPNFTTDSTSYLSGVKVRNYLTLGIDGKIGSTPVGKRHEQPWLKGKMLPLPCNCEVCKALKHWEVFALDTSLVAGLLAWHNMYVTSTHAKLWNAFAQTLSLEDYIKVVKENYKDSRGGSVDIINMIRYVECAFSEGLDVAEKRFESSMGNHPLIAGSMKPLFKKEATSDVFWTQGDSAAFETLVNYMSKEEMKSYGILVD